MARVDELMKRMLAKGWKPGGPASDESVAQVEKEFDVTFPGDYRAFLIAAGGGDTRAPEAYTGLLAVLFLVDPSVYVLAAAILPQAFVLPVTDSYVVARRIAVTPDHLQGRAEAARMTIVRTAAPLGALLAGILLSATSSRAAVGVFLALNAAEALYVTGAPSFRSPPD